MFRSFIKALVASHQASAARQIMDHLSDSQLQDLGYDRSTYVEGITAKVIDELFSQNNSAQSSAPVNANLVGAM
jgi:hypothetical protein